MTETNQAPETVETSTQEAPPKKTVVDLIELLGMAHDLLLVGTFPLQYSGQAISVVKNLEAVIGSLEKDAAAKKAAVEEAPKSE